jgi:hypothetical protein
LNYTLRSLQVSQAQSIPKPLETSRQPMSHYGRIFVDRYSWEASCFCEFAACRSFFGDSTARAANIRGGCFNRGNGRK